MKLNKFTTIFSSMVVLASPVVLAVSCSSGKGETAAALTPEQLEQKRREEIEAQKQAEILAVQARVDEIAISKPEILLSDSGRLKTTEQVLSEDGYMASDYAKIIENSITIEVVEISESTVTDHVNARVQISSTIAGVQPKFYETQIGGFSSVVNQESEILNDLINKATHQLMVDVTPEFVEGVSTLNTNGYFIENNSFTISIQNSVEYSVVSIDNVSEDGSSITVTVNAESQLLKDNAIEPNSRTFTTTISGFRQLTNLERDVLSLNIVDYNPVHFGDLPKDGTVYNDGPITFIAMNAMSAFMDLATLMGWQRETIDPQKFSNPHNENEIRWNEYLDVLKNIQFVDRDPAHKEYVLDVRRDGINLLETEQRQGFIVTDLNNGSFDADGDENTPNQWDTKLPYLSHFDGFISYKRPGAVITELNMEYKNGIFSSATKSEVIIASEKDSIPTHAIITDETLRLEYVNILYNCVMRTPHLFANSQSSMDVGRNFIDDDFIDAIKYIADNANNEKVFTKELAFVYFDTLNNGTYYWPAIEAFYRGIDNFPEELKNSSHPREYRDSYPGLENVDSLVSLRPWFNLNTSKHESWTPPTA